MYGADTGANQPCLYPLTLMHNNIIIPPSTTATIAAPGRF